MLVYKSAYSSPANNPPELIQGKDKVTIRFQAHPGAWAGGVFGCRVLRAD